MYISWFVLLQNKTPLVTVTDSPQKTKEERPLTWKHFTENYCKKVNNGIDWLVALWWRSVMSYIVHFSQLTILEYTGVMFTAGLLKLWVATLFGVAKCNSGLWNKFNRFLLSWYSLCCLHYAVLLLLQARRHGSWQGLFTGSSCKLIGLSLSNEILKDTLCHKTICQLHLLCQCT